MSKKKVNSVISTYITAVIEEKATQSYEGIGQSLALLESHIAPRVNHYSLIGE
ncbi:hypothetical protein TUM4641_03830 [Shewanella morhuae]|nr:hypothetical protein TUM4641_03830 [Shewanella morhuae]